MDLVLLKPGTVEVPEGLGSLVEGSIVGVDTDLKDCIELVSCNYGFSQQMTTDVSNQARTSGRPNINDITIVKYLDVVSPILYRHALSATPLDDGEENLTEIYLCRNSNQDGDDNNIGAIMTLTLSNCMISSVQAQSHPNDIATEQFTLNFTDIKWAANFQGVDANSIAGTLAYQWSVAKNRQTVS
jgi:type VI secretion system secreted protein Hcp|tara:strand:+ start:401 stop:958 length:558 start_codon:yes stop_codon:yes gene_type:complete